MNASTQGTPLAGRSVALYIFATMAVALFFGRGVYRAWHPALHDFSSPYAGCILFWSGGNPYDEREIARVLDERGATSTEHTPPVYFPTTFIALAPFSILPPVIAKATMMAGGAILLISAIWLWAGYLGIPSCLKHMVILAIAACNPFHTALSVANIALLTTGLMLLGAYLCATKRSISGSAIVMIACMLKPQIGIAAAIGLTTQSNFRQTIRLIAQIAAILLIILLLWANRQPNAIPCWMAALQSEFTTGSISAMNVLSMQRIDPGGLWSGVTGSMLPSLLQASIAVLFAISSGYLLRQRLRGNDQSAARYCWQLSGASIFLLLLGYHRGYDALLLCPVWLLMAYLHLVYSRMRAVYYSQFLWILPGAGFWLWLNQHGGQTFVDDQVFQYLWHAVVLRLHAWALIITAVGFVILAHQHSAHD